LFSLVVEVYLGGKQSVSHIDQFWYPCQTAVKKIRPRIGFFRGCIESFLLNANKRRIIIFQLGQRLVHRRHYLRTQLGRILGVEADLEAA
jgi:hypothetical protein